MRKSIAITSALIIMYYYNYQRCAQKIWLGVKVGVSKCKGQSVYNVYTFKSLEGKSSPRKENAPTPPPKETMIIIRIITMPLTTLSVPVWGAEFSGVGHAKVSF